MAYGDDKEKEVLTWNEVVIDTLKGKTKTAYTQYKAAQTQANELRKAFDALFEKDVRKAPDVCTDEQTVIVAHKFGKLSFAISDKAPSAARTRGNKFSFE